MNTILCLPSIISIWVLLPLAHLHAAHGAWWASVILFSHPTVGAWWHELLSSLKKEKHRLSLVSALTEFLPPTDSDLLVWLTLTFSHATEGVLVGLVGTHPAHHFWASHPRLVALRVGGHGVPSGKCWVSTISKRVLQIHTTPTGEKETC